MPIAIVLVSLCFSSRSVPEFFCRHEKVLWSFLAEWVVKQWRSPSLTSDESDAVQMSSVSVNFPLNSWKSVSLLFM